MLITACADHNHSHNYCIYATVCAMAWCRMVCGNTSESALCQSQLHHWITGLKFFMVFSVLPNKYSPWPLPSTHFPSQYSVISIHHTQNGGKWTSFNNPPLHLQSCQIFQPLNITQCSDFVPIQNFKTSQDGSFSAVRYSLDNWGIVVHIHLEARDSFLV